MRKLIIIIGIIGVIAGGAVLVQKTRAPRSGENTANTPEEQQVKSADAAINTSKEAIVTKKNGVTEVSLPSAPIIASAPSVEELKDFQKKSKELEAEVATLRQAGRTNDLVARIGDGAVRVDPLYTFEAQQKGLIGRESLPEEEGMLYVFQMDDAGRLFGTKGMKFAIDVVWMNSDKNVVHIHKNVPPDLNGDIKSLWPARYVLEVNAGYADRHGIHVGDTMDLAKIPH